MGRSLSGRLAVAIGLALLSGCDSRFFKTFGHNFTDTLSSKSSPDGAIAAAYVVERRGFVFSPETYGVTLTPTKADPRDGVVVLTEGDDDRPIVYRWKDNKTLVVRLPCGWWADLRDHYQLPRTVRIIDIKYALPVGCTTEMPAESPLE